MRTAKVLLIAIVLNIAVAAHATTLFTLPQQSVGPVSNFKAPAAGFSVPQGTSTITVTTNITQSDIADPTKSFTIAMESSNDGGATWRFRTSFTWQGGQNNPKTGLPDTTSPTMVFDVSYLNGQLVRSSITIPNALNIGIVVTSQ